MFLAIRELGRAKVRFLLLGGAVGLLVFLILFQQALLGGLITQFIGALRNQSATVLVYGAESRQNLEGSRVDATAVDAVAKVRGVADAGPLGQGTFTVTAKGKQADATLMGYRLGGPGQPTTLSNGRLATGDFEAVVSDGDTAKGFALGSTVTVEPGGRSIRIVGVATDARYSVTPTLFVSYATYEAARRTANPDAGAITPSAVAVTVDRGADVDVVAARITRSVDGTEALTRATAVSSSPGVSSVQQSFYVILGLFYIVVPLVAGLFFLIITFQKADSLTLLRALGAKPSMLIRNLLAQVVVVVLGGVILATALLAGAAQGTKSIGVKVDPTAVGVTAAVILGLALLSSLAAVRRVLAIDPVRAVTGGDVMS
ncbi:MAG: FtsX-like permease family protein [Acidimicrobiales bacterium]